MNNLDLIESIGKIVSTVISNEEAFMSDFSLRLHSSIYLEDFSMKSEVCVVALVDASNGKVRTIEVPTNEVIEWVLTITSKQGTGL